MLQARIVLLDADASIVVPVMASVQTGADGGMRMKGKGHRTKIKLTISDTINLRIGYDLLVAFDKLRDAARISQVC